MTDSNTAKYGFTSLSADLNADPPSTKQPKAYTSSNIPQLPQTPLAKRITTYAQSKLPKETYHHSLRVYTYGCVIARECYPKYKIEEGSSLEETWFLTAMLHDIGTCPGFLEGTRLSFEFWGGFHALQVLQGLDGGDSGSTSTSSGERGEGGQRTTTAAIAPREQAESVAEAIIRHQDVQDKGRITVITRLIHLGTLLDNVGANQELVHPDTIRTVNETYPRLGWSGCFSGTVRKEKELKPYAMVSRIEGFEEAIEKNGRENVKTWE